MNATMKLTELSKECTVSHAHGDITVTGLTADSRQVAPGMVFAALKGDKQDGARFIGQAVDAGASAVLMGTDQQIPDELPVALLTCDTPRRTFARMAARFYGAQPANIVAVTGTNGKTSVAEFTRQIWQAQGLRAASLGTIGLIAGDDTRTTGLTTPDPVVLHQSLAGLAARGVTHLALEASSHGLAQYRLDGVRLQGAAFTNLSRDHIDYHGSFMAYFAAKRRLFEELLADGGTIVIDADERQADAIATIARERRLTLISVGRAGETLRLERIEAQDFQQNITIRVHGRSYELSLPLLGAFQVSNALVAAGLALATGSPLDDILKALPTLASASGRMEHVGDTPQGAAVYVDYSHTPTALEKALRALRPFAAGRLIVVFGCGGDRDRPKRAQMGQTAAALADGVFVTDDNPRSEDPASIRAAVLTGCPGAREIGDRARAINTAIAETTAGDIVLIAGKGHETGQNVGTKTVPFSDQAVARAALKRLNAQEERS